MSNEVSVHSSFLILHYSLFIHRYSLLVTNA
jgi:hypothetical protein